MPGYLGLGSQTSALRLIKAGRSIELPCAT
jgi:hypothetical protein